MGALQGVEQRATGGALRPNKLTMQQYNDRVALLVEKGSQDEVRMLSSWTKGRVFRVGASSFQGFMCKTYSLFSCSCLSKHQRFECPRVLTGQYHSIIESSTALNSQGPRFNDADSMMRVRMQVSLLPAYQPSDSGAGSPSVRAWEAGRNVAHRNTFCVQMYRKFSL